MSLGTPYKRHSFTTEYDSIVIGSGIGGLSCAALLAEHGKERVLVLERHYTVGGFTHSFERPGFDWDVGVHYIGEVHREGSRARRIFDHLTGGQLAWADMGDVVDVVEIDGRRYELPRGRAALRERLTSYFPDEAAALDGYFAALSAVDKRSGPYFAEKALPRPLAALVGPMLRYPLLRYARRTTAEVLDELTSNEQLKAVLTAQWLTYGLPPDRSSFFAHAIVANHYLEGAAYPVGGAARIAATMLPTIERAGGALLVRAEVQEIVAPQGRAVGVRMADGRVLRARRIISNAGHRVTFGKLLREEPAAASPRPAREPSLSHIALYVGLDRTARELGLGRANLWLHRGADYTRNMAAQEQGPDAPFPVVYVSFPSAKDPDFERRHPGHATIEAMVPVPYGWFAAAQGAPWGKRGEAYDALKARLCERALATLTERLPAIRGHVVHAELSTPLSTRHFGGHPSGEIYGLAHSPARFADRSLRPHSGIPGLWLTGADVALAGVMGALMGGVLTASAILGRNLVGLLAKSPSIAQPGQPRPSPAG